jgi:hypothetical protein
MTAGKRWAALAAVFVAAGLVAAIPAFIHRSASHAAAARSWIDGLSFRTTAVGSATNGESLLAHRQRGTRDGVCFQLGEGGGACGSAASQPWETPLATKSIALVGRTKDRRGTGWWGVVGDRVKTVEARFGSGSTRRFGVHRGFVVFGDLVSVTAQDATGTDLGRVDGNDQATIECTPNACDLVAVLN